MICPYCRNPLPSPGESFCPSCGGDLRAAPPLPEDAAGEPVAPSALPPAGGGPRAGGSTPWEERERLGLGTALIDTTKGVLGEPARFFREMPVSGGIGSPLFYGVILGYIGLVAAALYQMVMALIRGNVPISVGDSPAERFLAGLQSGGGVGTFVVYLFLGPVLAALGIFMVSAIYHVMLLLLGGANRDFETTLRVVAYAQAAALFQLIPLCGGLIAGVYSLVLNVIGLSEAHGISRGKAAAAVLIPIVLICCCCAGVAFFAAGSIATMLGGMQR